MSHREHDPDGLYVVMVSKSRWSFNITCYHFMGDVTTATWKAVQTIRDGINQDKFQVLVFSSEESITLPKNFWGVRRITWACWRVRNA